MTKTSKRCVYCYDMEILSNKDLGREHIACDIKKVIKELEKNKFDKSQKRGIYIHGPPGSGKTTFVMKIMSELGYDVIKYDAGDIRNKSMIATMANNNLAENNVASLFKNKNQPIAILMDEIDGMNNGDKGGINSLIRLIRPKKTKKQQVEEMTNIPIVCVSNNHTDKKIKELTKVCNTYEFENLKTEQVSRIVDKIMPLLDPSLIACICGFVEGDLRKLNEINKIYKNDRIILNKEIINIMNKKSYSDETKEITSKLLNNRYAMKEHLQLINETDRTIVGLLWHENVIDYLEKIDRKVSFPLYQKIIDNICFADYIDRITFQKQIWQFNEMSSLIKIFNSSRILHDNNDNKIKMNAANIRFTKVLTKYSTEYNNCIFINKLCQELSLDKKDMLHFFDSRRTMNNDDLHLFLQPYDICKLDINRIYRYLENYKD